MLTVVAYVRSEARRTLALSSNDEVIEKRQVFKQTAMKKGGSFEPNEPPLDPPLCTPRLRRRAYLIYVQAFAD